MRERDEQSPKFVYHNEEDGGSLDYEIKKGESRELGGYKSNCITQIGENGERQLTIQREGFISDKSILEMKVEKETSYLFEKAELKEVIKEEEGNQIEFKKLNVKSVEQAKLDSIIQPHRSTPIKKREGLRANEEKTKDQSEFE